MCLENLKKQTNKKTGRPEWLEWNEQKENGGVREGGRWCGTCSHFKEWSEEPLHSLEQSGFLI